MNTFKISSTLKKNIIDILKRRNINYILHDNSIEIDLSGTKFHKIVTRAKMEKLTEERHSKIPYVHFSEMDDKGVLDEVGDYYLLYERL